MRVVYYNCENYIFLPVPLPVSFLPVTCVLWTQLTVLLQKVTESCLICSTIFDQKTALNCFLSFDQKTASRLLMKIGNQTFKVPNFRLLPVGRLPKIRPKTAIKIALKIRLKNCLKLLMRRFNWKSKASEDSTEKCLILHLKIRPKTCLNCEDLTKKLVKIASEASTKNCEII